MDKPTFTFTLRAGCHSVTTGHSQYLLLGPPPATNWKLASCTCTLHLHLPTLPTCNPHPHTHVHPQPATAPSRPCRWSCCSCSCCLLFPATDALGETATLQRWNGKEGLDGGVAEKG